MANERKDGWDKAKIVASVSVPIVLAVIGAVVNTTLGNAKTSVEYVKLAAGILTDQSKASHELRSWGADVLSALGPVPFNPTVKRELTQGKAHLASPARSSRERLQFRSIRGTGEAMRLHLQATLKSHHSVLFIVGASQTARDTWRRIGEMGLEDWRTVELVKPGDLEVVHDTLGPMPVQNESILAWGAAGVRAHRLSDVLKPDGGLDRLRVQALFSTIEMR